MVKESDEITNEVNSKRDKIIGLFSNAFVILLLPFLLVMFNFAFQSGYFIYFKIPFVYIEKNNYNLLINNIQYIFKVLQIIVASFLFIITIIFVFTKTKRRIPPFIEKIFYFIITPVIIIIYFNEKEYLVGISLCMAYLIIPLNFIKTKITNKQVKKNEQILSGLQNKNEKLTKQEVENLKKNLNEGNELIKSTKKYISKYRALLNVLIILVGFWIALFMGQAIGIYTAGVQDSIISMEYQDNDYIIFGTYESSYIVSELNKDSLTKDYNLYNNLTYKYKLISIESMNGYSEIIKLEH